MTQIHNFDQDVRRHSDGSIDFDHYRARAIALRGSAMRDARSLKAFFRLLAVTAVATVGVVFVALAPAPVVDASCRQCTQRLVPVDAPLAAVHVVSSPRLSRAE